MIFIAWEAVICFVERGLKFLYSKIRDALRAFAQLGAGKMRFCLQIGRFQGASCSLRRSATIAYQIENELQIS